MKTEIKLQYMINGAKFKRVYDVANLATARERYRALIAQGISVRVVATAACAALLTACATVYPDAGPAFGSDGPKQRAALAWRHGPGVPVVPEGSDKHECGFGSREIARLPDGKVVIRCRDLTLLDIMMIGAHSGWSK